MQFAAKTALAVAMVVALMVAASSLATAQTETGEVTVSIQVPTAMAAESGFWNFGYVSGEDLLQRKRTLSHALADPNDPLRYRSTIGGAWRVDSTCDPAVYPDMVWETSPSTLNRLPLAITVNNVRIINPTLSYYSKYDALPPFRPGFNLAYAAVKYGKVKFEDRTNGDYAAWPGLEQAEVDALLRISVNWKTASSIDPYIVWINPQPDDPDWGRRMVKFTHTFACDELFPPEQPPGT